MQRLRAMGFAAALLAGLSASGMAAAEAITGTILYAGPPVAPRKVDVTIDQYVCGHDKEAADLLVSPRRELRNAVVWIDNPPADRASPMPGDKVELDQRGCVFVPRVVVVQAGGTVNFLNGDRLLHNLHATPKLNVSFNRTQPRDRTIPIVFSKPEIVRINCDLHSWMLAWVVVAAHRYYAVTGADGRFTFDGLPPGNYTLTVWHEDLGTTQANVTVAADRPARITVEMKGR